MNCKNWKKKLQLAVYFMLYFRCQNIFICKGCNKQYKLIRSHLVKSRTTLKCEDAYSSEEIAEFEAKGKLDSQPEEVEVGQAPAFISEFKDAFKEEGDTAYFEAQVSPKGDSTMTVEWLKDGKPVQESKLEKMEGVFLNTSKIEFLNKIGFLKEQLYGVVYYLIGKL